MDGRQGLEPGLQGFLAQTGEKDIMTHIPRSRPRIWPLLLISLALILFMAAVSRVRHTAHQSYEGRDAGNPWGGK